MIEENVRKILKNIPAKVVVVAAAKSRSSDDVDRVVAGGINTVGENYVQEAASHIELLGNKAKWHFIGHLQKNKIKQAARLFDMIETLDSFESAKILNEQCAKINKVMPVLIEVNSACESQKAGVMPDSVETFIDKIIGFSNISLNGLMTMGPWLEDNSKIRPYFKITKELFDRIVLKYPDLKNWKYLSMGMSASYAIAIEEGANMVRIGEAIFGPRKKAVSHKL